MVEISCPHCEEEIELDDDAIGNFECPHCDEGFEWGDEVRGILSREIYRVLLVVCVIGFVVSLILMSYYANMDDDNTGSASGGHPGYAGGPCSALVCGAFALIFLLGSLFPFVGFMFRREGVSLERGKK